MLLGMVGEMELINARNLRRNQHVGSDGSDVYEKDLP